MKPYGVWVVADERDIPRLALQEARRCGDPDPALAQHTIGTREAATKTTGSSHARSTPVGFATALSAWPVGYDRGD